MRDIEKMFADQFFARIAQHFAKAPIDQCIAPFAIDLRQADSNQIECLSKALLALRQPLLAIAHRLGERTHGLAQLIELAVTASGTIDGGEIAKILPLQILFELPDGVDYHARQQRAQQSRDNGGAEAPH